MIFALGSQSILITWENAPLKDKSFIPEIGKTVKTIFLQHYLIFFNSYYGEPIFAFDFKEEQWLKVKLNGDDYSFNSGSSICLYDNKTMIMFGTDGKEDLLSILSFSDSDGGKLLTILIDILMVKEMQIHHDLTHLQKRLMKSGHSANILDSQMYIYGGYMNDVVNGDLSVIDLSTIIFFSA